LETPPGAFERLQLWRGLRKQPGKQGAPPAQPGGLPVYQRALRNSSKTRDTGLDPFGNSGTTLIACERTGRRARLIEMEPAYSNVIIRRNSSNASVWL
jgi:DNA modification methylase